jgi:hypothetical protein
MRHVVLGPTEGDKAAVEIGLAHGEVVVMEGVDQWSRGMHVAARLAGASTAKENACISPDSSSCAQSRRPC